MEWKNPHEPTCPVTSGRRDLLKQLAMTPDDPYLRGALPEYDEGGDQEVELCECSKKTIEYRVVFTEPRESQPQIISVHTRDINSGFNSAIAEATEQFSWEISSVEFWQVRD